MIRISFKSDADRIRRVRVHGSLYDLVYAAPSVLPGTCFALLTLGGRRVAKIPPQLSLHVIIMARLLAWRVEAMIHELI